MSQLADFIHQKRQQKPILSMTHVVYGYPSVEESLSWMERLMQEGVDFIEVQFPFSDPVADGPSIVAACHKALEQKLDVETCLSQLGKLAKNFPDSRIVLMSYLNPMYRFGLDKLAKRAAEENILGLILPDLPIEQAATYQAACKANGIDPVWLVTPATPKDRLAMLAGQASGFLYCVARSGVTGHSVHEGKSKVNVLDDYLAEIKTHASAPMGVGFGLRHREQIEQLTGKADIAILGSALLDAYNNGGQDQGIKLIKDLFH
ncbi:MULTISPECIES: tryptophan synthase subunit alpha [Marinomonas]|uniref:Tryptophan synthase alpha chain n=1 Tax=Marinomonas arctica TaxID=383750 RepID=A0A7H1J2H0_9GAMM|nr:MULTISPECIES: tryptophan synthase subunit alpha [Marinomonas]MCS7488529.1 tryptophan synthase subunit alpha [Marinomonas sp. BSi20414]QNT04686.1 tryptophan synthase subunit alpha [Marinomonas arctica]GGN32341.1 tryptophan synthase alpha chain [Marinomonas arctica]